MRVEQQTACFVELSNDPSSLGTKVAVASCFCLVSRRYRAADTCWGVAMAGLGP